MTRDVALVLTTVRRPEALRAYFANARAHGFDLRRVHAVVVTEDHCDVAAVRAMLADEGVAGEVFDDRGRRRWMEERGVAAYADLVPRRSHAETSFGLLRMMADPALAHGLFVDDDTSPEEADDWFGTHLAQLAGNRGVRTLASTTRWVNVLHERFDRHGLYPRGYPYSAMRESYEERPPSTGRVVASQGLWTDVPDLDAVRILQDGDLDGQARTRTTRADFGAPFAAAPGNYLTVCSMNLAFRREIIPAFYQMPMDDNPWRIGRFDDIWSGVILKRAADAMDHVIVNGPPLCRHEKAPRSTFKDLAAEAPALELNEHLWEVLDAVPVDPRDGYAGAARAFAAALEATKAAWANADFLPYVGERLARWVECCERLEARA